ncbi:retinal short-chain dehydrogenase reductase [Melanogaster broomeanus]|nr:retinal short-chain dehydrogenase reductase [Melanogaster broomeanus]
MTTQPGGYDASPMYDNLDIDMIIKVLGQTAFSPFFTCFIPIFYWFQGGGVISPTVVNTACYCAVVSSFWLVKWLSILYRNQGSLFFAPKPLDWSEQIVCSSGMGELLANTLAVRNVNVVVLDIKPIQTENHNIVYYKCDVSNWEEVQAVSKRVIEGGEYFLLSCCIGHPTMLVNNAGVVQGKLILDLQPHDIQQTFGVNTLAHFWTLKAFLPKMIERNSGHIVTLSSVMGYVGCAQMTDYCASKAALVNMHESLRYELDNRYVSYHRPGIRTTIVSPGHVHTPLFSTMATPNNVLHRFLWPSLAPVTVVKAIITALDSQQSQTLFMPSYTHLSVVMRCLPSFVRDFMQKLSCADFMMEGFRKVTAVRDDEVDLSQGQENTKLVLIVGCTFHATREEHSGGIGGY